MTNYIGVKCPVCGKKFAGSDDIVVCPTCGAPHHRECYWKTGECAFVDEHINGKDWAPPPPEAGEGGAGDGVQTRSCPRCHTPNPAEAIFCQVCGSRMNEPVQGQQAPPPGYQPPYGGYGQPPQQGGGTPPPGGQQPPQGWGFGTFMEMHQRNMAYGGLSPDDTIDGETVQDLAMYVRENTAYYLPRFKAIDKSSRFISPNLGALVFNFFFYFYRKMYLVGGILLGLGILSLIPSVLYSIETMPDVVRQMATNDFFYEAIQEIGWDLSRQVNYDAANYYLNLGSITRVLNLTIGIVVSFTANRLYYFQAVKAVKKLRKTHGENPQQLGWALSRAGGCSRLAVILLAVALMVAYFALGTALVYYIMG